jgi:hypothetical protein
VFKPSPITPNYKDYLIFEGISVDEAGKQHYLDVHIAYRQACLNAIEYLKKFGYSGAQAYSILGTAPCQGHISGVVDVPNACATLWLPTEIFDFDIMPAGAQCGCPMHPGLASHPGSASRDRPGGPPKTSGPRRSQRSRLRSNSMKCVSGSWGAPVC